MQAFLVVKILRCENLTYKKQMSVHVNVVTGVQMSAPGLLPN